MRSPKWIPVFAALLLLASPALAVSGDSDFSRIMQEADKLAAPAPAGTPAAVPAAPPAPVSAPAPQAGGEEAEYKAPPEIPFEYEPEECEFRMILPGEPEMFRRCDADDPKKCGVTTSYTRVFELRTTVDFIVTCIPAEPGMYEKYSGEVMERTLSEIAKDQLEKFESSYQQFDVAKQSTILGTGRQGVSPMIYMAQLWIGRHSLLTVEGRIIGDERDDADKIFAETLRTVRHKNWKIGPEGVPIIPPGAVIADPPAAAKKTPAQTSEPAAGTPAPKKKGGKDKPAAPAN